MKNMRNLLVFIWGEIDVCSLTKMFRFMLPSQSNVINLLRKSNTNIIVRYKWQKLVRTCLREKKQIIFYILCLYLLFLTYVIACVVFFFWLWFMFWRWQYFRLCKSRDSAVCIATGYELDEQGVVVRVLVGARILTFPCHPDRLRGPPSLLSNGHRGTLSPGVKRPWRDADHSPPTSAKVKKTWVYTSTPPYVFMT
jgi:hypothetical protein